ncbi:MAG: hypothetical protein ACRDUS_07805 [Mycobacterium sp.]
MTTPPQPPPEEGPPGPGQYPYGPSGYPPPGYPQYPPGYHPYWTPPPKSNSGTVLGMAFVGVFLFWVSTFGTLLLLENVMRGGFTADTRGVVLAVVMSIIGWATVAIMTGFVVGCMSMLDGLE